MVCLPLLNANELVASAEEEGKICGEELEKGQPGQISMAVSSQHQLESLQGVCNALLAQVAKTSQHLSEKEQEVLMLRSRLQMY